jgi:hypothetical protein
LGDGKLKGKNASKAIIKTVNTATGKESAKDKSFNEFYWGVKTRSYLESVERLEKAAFAKIATKAQEFAKMSGRLGETEDVEVDERAFLVDVSDDGNDEDDGMFTNPPIY